LLLLTTTGVVAVVVLERRPAAMACFEARSRARALHCRLARLAASLLGGLASSSAAAEGEEEEEVGGSCDGGMSVSVRRSGTRGASCSGLGRQAAVTSSRPTATLQALWLLHAWRVHLCSALRRRVAAAASPSFCSSVGATSLSSARRATW
jgi:hypothetical protein